MGGARGVKVKKQDWGCWVRRCSPNWLLKHQCIGQRGPSHFWEASMFGSCSGSVRWELMENGSRCLCAAAGGGLRKSESSWATEKKSWFWSGRPGGQSNPEHLSILILNRRTYQESLICLQVWTEWPFVSQAYRKGKYGKYVSCWTKFTQHNPDHLCAWSISTMDCLLEAGAPHMKDRVGVCFVQSWNVFFY